jgi:UDP-galactopyranose mutase
MKTALVLGGGFAGCTAAYLLGKIGFRVTLLEAESGLGGGARTRFYGGHPYTLGPRVFFSRDEQVVRQLTGLTEIREFYTRTWTYVESDGRMYRYPLQVADLPLMPDHRRIQEELRQRQGKTPSVEDFERYWLDAVGPTLYGKFVENYSRKMWGIESNRQLVANFEWVNRGTPIRQCDDRLYTDQFQGYPRDLSGYNGYFERCVAGCDVLLDCMIERFAPETRQVTTAQGEFTGDIIVNTIPVDHLFGYEYGTLQFCGRQFIPLWLPSARAFPEDVTWIHYSGHEEHTRVTEFKKITGYEAPDTVLGIEISAPRGRYYPVQSPPELARHALYRKLFPSDFHSIGRLGKFRYQGIADAIRDALDVAEETR